MQALVLSNNAKLLGETTAVLFEKGFHVVGLNDVPAAEKFLRKSQVDVLIMEERVGGNLTHGMSLLAEYRNIATETILVTEREGPEVDELFDLLPSLHCILGGAIDPAVVGRIAFGMISGTKVSADIVRDTSTVEEEKSKDWNAAIVAQQRNFEAARDRVSARAAAFAAAKMDRLKELDSTLEDAVRASADTLQPAAHAAALTQDALFRASLRPLGASAVHGGNPDLGSARRFALDPDKLRAHADSFEAEYSSLTQEPARAQG